MDLWLIIQRTFTIGYLLRLRLDAKPNRQTREIQVLHYAIQICPIPGTFSRSYPSLTSHGVELVYSEANYASPIKSVR